MRRIPVRLPREIDVDIKGAMPLPDLLEGDLVYNVMRFGWRHTQFLRFKLKKDEKQLHKSAVYFMLENAPERQDSQLVQQEEAGKWQGRCDTFISSEWRPLPYVSILHQNTQQRKAYDQYCL